MREFSSEFMEGRAKRKQYVLKICNFKPMQDFLHVPLYMFRDTNPRSTHLTSSLGQYHHPSHVEIKISVDELRAMVGEMLHTSPTIWGHDAGSHFGTATN